jgi:outer membrane protein assembly factor BamB
MSGIAIADGLLFTLIQKEGQQWLMARNPLTGELRWQVAVAAEYKNAQGDGPRATPTIHNGEVYIYTGQGILCCVSLRNHKLLWSHDVISEVGGKVADYGMSSSPLIAATDVIVTAGAPQACVVAYSILTGRRSWTVGDDPAGYSSPALLNIRGHGQIVAFTGGSVMGLEATFGDVRWRYEYETDYRCNTASPICADGDVFISSGENHGSAMLRLNRRDNIYQVEEVWKSQGPQSVLRCEWQTPILLDGKLYGLDNSGSAGPITNLTCIDAATGKRVWQQPRFGKSNCIAADGKLFFSTMAGELVVVRATPKGYEEFGRKQVLGPTRQAPALANGMLYLRDDKEIVCLDVRK